MTATTPPLLGESGRILPENGLCLKKVRNPKCISISLTVKAVHLELFSDLTTDAFIACLRCFIAGCGKLQTIWTNHGTNLVDLERTTRII